jgi:hypothetical protein
MFKGNCGDRAWTLEVEMLESVPVLGNRASPLRLSCFWARRPDLTVGVCSATRANPDIGYSLGENDPLVTRFGFPWRWRDSVNGSLCDWLPLFPSPLSRLTLL